MASAYWKGALELGGYPINVGLYPRVKSRSGESFKTLAPNGEPVKQLLVDSDGEVVERANTQKGVEVGPDQYKPIPPTALEALAALERTEVAAMKGLVSKDSIPFEFTVQSYTVAPDKKVPGAKLAADQLWNGLRGGDLAYITQITMRAGQRDAILAVYATDEGLRGVTLPFLAELHEVVEAEAPEVDEAAQAQFAGADVPAFDHATFDSRWRETRATAIELALDGKDLPAPTPAAVEAPAAKPNLTGILAGVIKEEGATRGGAKPKAKPKAKAKKPTVKKDPVRGKSKVTA